MKRTLCWFAVAALAMATPAAAQSHTEGLANLVSDLILKGITLPGAEAPGNPHAGHFTLGDPTFGGSQAASVPDSAAIGAVVAFADRLTAQFANFPLGSSTGGFTYSLDEASGARTRNTTSFGPAFAERAATIGKRKLSIGANYQHSSFDTFGGENLSDGSISFYLPHTDCCSAAAPPPSPDVPGFEGDLIQASLRLKATTSTVALFANYGVTNRFDVGVAIPISRVDLEADVDATILRLSTADNPRVHTFVDGQDVSQKSFGSTGSASGIGDIVLRTKYNLLHADSAAGGNSGVAVGFDLRLPTGDEHDLLGLGTTQGKIFLILSSGTDRIATHVNVGYTASGKGHADEQFGFDPIGVSDEFGYAGGIELVAHPRLTILGDLLGRTLFNAGDLEIENKTFPYRLGSAATAAAPLLTSSTNPITGEPYRQLALQRDSNLNLVLGSAGFKFNAADNLLVGANVLFPLTKAGLRDRLTFAFGVDYAF